MSDSDVNIIKTEGLQDDGLNLASNINALAKEAADWLDTPAGWIATGAFAATGGALALPGLASAATAYAALQAGSALSAGIAGIGVGAAALAAEALAGRSMATSARASVSEALFISSGRLRAASVVVGRVVANTDRCGAIGGTIGASIELAHDIASGVESKTIAEKIMSDIDRIMRALEIIDRLNQQESRMNTKDERARTEINTREPQSDRDSCQDSPEQRFD